jgi:hypothetical protein
VVPRLSRRRKKGFSSVWDLEQAANGPSKPFPNRGGIAMAGEFACVACGIKSEKDDVVLIQECRLCRRAHCDGCLNEEGVCVECSQK